MALKQSLGTPDFFIGDAESQPPHWGGAPRAGFVEGKPRLATGTEVWRVRFEPALPGKSGEGISHAVLAPHDSGRSLSSIRQAVVSVYVCVPKGPSTEEREQFRDGDLSILYWATIATSVEALPRPIDYAAEWTKTLSQIRRFIERHGHARVPEPYFDEDGRLDVIVANIRWHHAGKAGVSPGPFPGVDYAQDLDELPGWEW